MLSNEHKKDAFRFSWLFLLLAVQSIHSDAAHAIIATDTRQQALRLVRFACKFRIYRMCCINEEDFANSLREI